MWIYDIEWKNCILTDLGGNYLVKVKYMDIVHNPVVRNPSTTFWFKIRFWHFLINSCSYKFICEKWKIFHPSKGCANCSSSYSSALTRGPWSLMWCIEEEYYPLASWKFQRMSYIRPLFLHGFACIQLHRFNVLLSKFHPWFLSIFEGWDVNSSQVPHFNHC